ncbi:MAG: hypothetical protein SFW67_30180 [Myxococcaceae bacterium]|nr:hypothetical protein [Myxococcaceae bacterium]
MKRPSRRVPVDAHLTQLVDRAIRRHTSELRDFTHRFHERWKRWGITTIRGSGWALRPLFVPADRLDFIASALHSRLVNVRAELRRLAAKRGALSKALPLPEGFEAALDVGAGLASHDWFSHLRPDGFLFEDRFVLSEINFGNGIAVSCGYTEVVADYWREHPLLKRLGIDADRFHRRPLPRYLFTMLRAMRPSPKPFVALLAHHREWAVIQGYPKRVEDQFDYVQRELYRLGVDSRIVTEAQLVVGRDGDPRIVGDKRRPDLVMLVTIGSSFLDEPHLLKPKGPLAHLRGARIGSVAIVKPLAATLMDKGVLPLLQRVEGDASSRMADGYRFEVSPTHVPSRARRAAYLRDQADWVFKRAFDGKDTHLGIARTPGLWRKVVDVATSEPGYVAQRYVSLPRATIPVFVDEKHLEFIESRVELSSFIFDGTFGGGAARHAPDAEGLVMTDPPEDYGFSTVFAV